MMKLKTFFTALALAFTALAFAQDFTVKYKMELSSTQPEIQAQLGLMGGSTMTIYSKGTSSRMETNIGNGLMVTTAITDMNKKKSVMLMDGLMGKQGAFMDLNENANEEDTDIDIDFVVTNETKKILGHTCKKVIVDLEENGEMIYWVTEDIKPQEGFMGKYGQKGLPGLPLEFLLDAGEVTTHFMATEFDAKANNAKSLFKVEIPKGYKETNLDAIMKLGGGM